MFRPFQPPSAQDRGGITATSSKVPGAPGKFSATVSCSRMGETRTDIKADPRYGYHCGHPSCQCLADSKAAAGQLEGLLKMFS